MAIISEGVPTGTIFAYAGAVAPDGYLLCDGSAVSRTTYARLFEKIKTAHGYGDGSTTFGLPNLQNRFVRGTGGSADPEWATREPSVSGTFSVSATWSAGVRRINCTTTNVSVGLHVTQGPIDANKRAAVDYVAPTYFTYSYTDGSNVVPASSGSGTVSLSRSTISGYPGSYQGHSTAAPATDFRTTDSGQHRHRILLYADDFMVSGTATEVADNDSTGATSSDYWTTDAGGSHTHTISGGGDAETAPISLCLNYIIKI